MADASDAAAAAPQADLARAQREITDKRGYSFAEFEWLAEKDPAYEKARLDYASMIYTPENPALPVKYRETIVLCDLHEMSYVEAAATLDCAVGTVRSRLHRARGMLLEKLKARKRAFV